MTKKDKKKGALSQESQRVEMGESANPISKRGWKMIGGGVLTAIVGFIVLSFTDPGGQNFASRLSPFLIIGGYTIIGFGIVAKDPTS